ncbi:hypothetical protein STAS_16673 [Striga asiatica]|uniref:Uncharacterized protein n=1 Tax=Striga asiatica TaxID=4170 RepID=A0A5A7Q528_STRAF|nr:hypothetical protein STAS_16673 [Striga asiatica]
MINALRLKRTQQPISVFSYSQLPNHIITRKPSSLRFVQSVSRPGSEPNKTDSSNEMDQEKGPAKEMDQKKSPETSNTSDTMSSMGEAYATRSDEEGFGGIYGGNQYLDKDDDEKNVHGKDTEFDESQGSEVKEKEKARNQSKIAS